MNYAIAALSLILATQYLGGCSTTHTQRAALVAAATPELEMEYRQALELMQAGQWQTAREHLTRITTRQPSFSGPWVNLGITRTMLGEHASAETDFKTAIAVNSLNIEAYNQLGMLYRRHGRLDEAQFIYEEALRHDPDNTSIHWNLGILYDRYLAYPRQALQHYRRYQQLTGSDDPRLQVWMAELDQRNHSDKLSARVKP